ncbi:MAG: HEAT repeat domain-containing protein, partial [Planctomycetota bacterium]
GGSFRVSGGVAIVIDISGNDRYEAAKDHSQGAGALGVGALVDMAGDDSYTGKRFSQGCGFIGTGMLYDYKGNDAYRAESFCQGAAAFGMGCIWEGAGDDSYKAVSLAQAAGSTMGIGAVIEHGGDDTYECESGAQGFGSGQWTYPRSRNYAFCGGLGLMLEYGGNDRYACKKFAQGAGRLMAAGILVDEGGNDTYSADEHAAGDGSHLAFGMLIDRSGNDSYESRDQSIGASLDRSAGILLDVNGDDRYKSGRAPGCLCRAVGPGAFALMIDFSGNDKYVADTVDAETPSAPGSVLPPAFWNDSPTAVFIDLGGKDEYGGIGKNNANWIQFEQGVGIDTGGASVSRGRAAAVADYPSLMKYGTITLTDTTGETIPSAGSANLFERFHELAPFVSDFSGNADRLFLFPNHPSPFVRDAAREAVIERAAAVKWGTESFGLKSGREPRAENGNPRPPERPAEALSSQHYSALLKSSNVDMRIFGAAIARYTADRSAAAHLLKALRDDDAQVRRFSAEALGNIADENTLPALIDALAAEKAAVAREAMTSALGKFKNREAAAAICEALQDDCPGVRAAACAALGAIGDGNAVEKTSPLLKDRSEFVRRAAALALMETVPKIWGYGDADVAIGFLDHANKEVRERMLDALKKSTGQDFGYDKKKWLNWLNKNRPRTSR